MSAADDAGPSAAFLTLAEVARVLESVDKPHERVQRALELVGAVVPCTRCGVLTTSPSRWLIVTPATYGEDTERLRSRLTRALALLTDERAPGGSGDDAANLTVPITGLDQVIGVLSVEPPAGVTLEVEHLRLLTVVASQLGAYLTMLRLRDEESRATRKLVAAHDFQQLLVGMVSHDLRNPLSVITVAATNLLRRPGDPALQRTYERTLRCAQKANRIISDLLDVTDSRVKGELGINPRRMELKAHLEEIIGDARITHGVHPIELEVPAGEVWGQWDADRLTQAISNLVNNAVQHGDEGTKVRVRLEALPDAVTIGISNQGAVIAPELVDVMFDPFKSGPQAPRKAGAGLGLALYIVRQICEAHGGRIDCRSYENGTTLFTLRLPRAARALDGPRPVLVVDDDGDVRASMVEALEGHGFRVAPAANGERALEQLKKGLKPRVVLLDLHMPVMDGATFHAQLLEDPDLRVIPVLVLSSDSAEAVRLTQAGAAGFLPKPLQVESLLAQVKKLAASAA